MSLWSSRAVLPASFFECRKHKDLYLWMAKCPNGPSVKFLVNAVHTMEELKLTGNHLIRGSRPLLTFSSNFDKDAHWKIIKEIIIQADDTYTHNIEKFVQNLCELTCKKGVEHQRSLRASSLQCLLAMVWFIAEISCIFADFDEVLSGLEISSAQPTGKQQPTVIVNNKIDFFQSLADITNEKLVHSMNGFVDFH